MKFLLLLAFFLMLFFYYKIYKKRKLNRKEKIRITEMVKDEVCGVYLPKEEALKVEIEDKVYYFCSQECKDAFLKGRSERA
ncbi:MAG: YHS domain-containing protein [Caldimicrobium sp.]|jgi:YHS domain-containing protein|nr:YHS domain-containing protein [Caldimicrobium sp.]